MAAFDAAISKDFGTPLGMLARELRISIPPNASLTTAWSDYLIGSSDAVLRDGLAELLEVHADFVPERVIEAFANVMLVSLGVRLAASSKAGPAPFADKYGLEC